MLACRYQPCHKMFKSNSGRVRHEKIHHMMARFDKMFVCSGGHHHKSKHAANQCAYRARKSEGGRFLNPFGFVDENQ